MKTKIRTGNVIFVRGVDVIGQGGLVSLSTLWELLSDIIVAASWSLKNIPLSSPPLHHHFLMLLFLFYLSPPFGLENVHSHNLKILSIIVHYIMYVYVHSGYTCINLQVGIDYSKV